MSRPAATTPGRIERHRGTCSKTPCSPSASASCMPSPTRSTAAPNLQVKTEARLAVFTWIEAWYNPRRRQWAHGRILPINFARMHADELKPPPNAQHGLPTAGLCVAGATPAVDNPAPVLTITRESSHQPSARAGQLHICAWRDRCAADAVGSLRPTCHRDRPGRVRRCRPCPHRASKRLKSSVGGDG